MFIVCIRNLIMQQTDALARIIGSDVVRGADDQLTLVTLASYFDVVVATAQVNCVTLCCAHWLCFLTDYFQVWLHYRVAH